ncbi:MAG: hypothetical protein GPI96_21670 [Microcystis aeruginosa BS13-02]|nr:hypothetical protein [Microcystis aeruginosa BS13-02]
MYRVSTATPSETESFELPFGGKLSNENRWVIMANLIPWEKFGSSRLCVIIFAYGIVKCLSGNTFRTILSKKLSV